MGDGGHEAGPYSGRSRGKWGPHQAAMSPAFQDPGWPQPNPRPADTHGSWWDGGLGSLEARERQRGDALALGGGVAGAGGEGSPQGPLPRHREWPPTSPKRGSPGARRKDRWKQRGRAGAGRKGKGENGGEKGREERGKEQMEGKEGGKEERKVKTEGRGAQAKPGEGEAGPGKGPRPLP